MAGNEMWRRKALAVLLASCSPPIQSSCAPSRRGGPSKAPSDSPRGRSRAWSWRSSRSAPARSPARPLRAGRRLQAGGHAGPVRGGGRGPRRPGGGTRAGPAGRRGRPRGDRPDRSAGAARSAAAGRDRRPAAAAGPAGDAAHAAAARRPTADRRPPKPGAVHRADGAGRDRHRPRRHRLLRGGRIPAGRRAHRAGGGHRGSRVFFRAAGRATATTWR